MRITQTFSFEVPMVNIDFESGDADHAAVCFDQDEARELYQELHKVFGGRKITPRPIAHVPTFSSDDFDEPELDLADLTEEELLAMEAEAQENGHDLRVKVDGQSKSPEEALAWLQIQQTYGPQKASGDVSMPAGWKSSRGRAGGSGIGSRQA